MHACACALCACVRAGVRACVRACVRARVVSVSCVCMFARVYAYLSKYKKSFTHFFSSTHDRCMEGEGLDRTGNIGLPGVQETLLNELAAADIPFVLVMISGGLVSSPARYRWLVAYAHVFNANDLVTPSCTHTRTH